MEKVTIREIEDDQLKVYRIFFRKGLIEDEECFRISPVDEINTSFPTKGKEDSFTLGAYMNNHLAGVVSFQRDGNDREKARHKGILFRMYVSETHRGLGIGRKLIEELLIRAEKLENMEIINLTVISNNDKAKKLYQSFGFKTFSVEENAIKWKGKYLNEEQMRKVLP